MTAVRALTEIWAPSGSVDRMATDTAERRFSARVFKKRIITAIVKSPKAKEQASDEEAENSSGGDEVHC